MERFFDTLDAEVQICRGNSVHVVGIYVISWTLIACGNRGLSHEKKYLIKIFNVYERFLDTVHCYQSLAHMRFW
jgi:hypothetical protein